MPATSRTSATLFTIALSYVGIGLLAAQGIILVPLYLREIGVESYGAWLATGNIIGYLGLLDFGFSDVLKQRVATVLGGTVHDGLGELVATGLILALLPAILVVLVSWGLSPWVPGWVGLVGSKADTLSSAFRLSGLSTGLTIASFACVTIAQAAQRPVLIGVGWVSTSALGIATTVVLLLQGHGLVALPAGQVVRAGTFLAISTAQLVVLLHGELRCRLTPTWRQLKSMASVSWTVFATRLGSTLIGQSDSLVIATLLSPENATTLGLSSRVRDSLQMLPERITTSTTASLAHLAGEGIPERVRKVTATLFSATIGIAIFCAAGILGLNKAFMRLWLGADLWGGNWLNVTLSAVLVLAIAKNFMSNALFSVGAIRLSSFLSLAEAALKVALAIPLISALGIVGAPLAALAATLSIGILWLAPAFTRHLGYNRGDHPLPLRPTITYAATALPLGLAWSFLPAPTTWLGFAASTVALGTALALLLLLLHSELRAFGGRLLARLLPRRSRIPSDDASSSPYPDINP